MQQHIAGGIDAHIQTVAAARAVATVAGLTREDVELWLSGWCMIGPKGEFDCSGTVPEPENVVKALFGSRLTKSNSVVNNPRVNTNLSTTPIAITPPQPFGAAGRLARARNLDSMCRISPCCPT
jgi:hypothetical protein